MSSYDPEQKPSGDAASTGEAEGRPTNGGTRKTVQSWNDRVSAKLPKFSLTEQTHVYISNALFVVAFLQSIPYLIFAVRVWQTGETEGLELAAIYAQIVISAFWVAYGVSLSNFILIIASTLLIVVNVVLVFLIYRARAKEDADAA